ncbi:MAG: phosphate ABC transporter permease PstA [Candidatus Borkfalkiaceae bacterium]|nr:phosphate ABC transporter permease PstA [Clostridia bacterium]MDY6223085.1 phosphate ABC transporter permease PstA [Christensenellaceae bacterium]
MRKFYSALKIVCYVALGVSLTALAAIVVNVLVNGAGKLSFRLLFGQYKSASPTVFPALVGTLQLVLIAILIAVPVGTGCAIFLAEYTNNKGKFVKAIRIATETLAGIPSIVYGLFGYLIFVVAFGWGYSMLGGGITLAIMILPTVVRSTEESLLAVQSGLREGAYALGASKVRTIFKIVLPSAASGVVTAIILSIGRVVSESAVLILTVGMVVNKVPETLLSPGTSLALDIYYFASHGYPNEAAATAVVLLIFVICLNLLASGAGKLIKRKTGEAK